MSTLAATLLGKSISFASRFLKKGGGSAAPGLYALKLDPNLVKTLSSQIAKNVIVTGTNGKTTTSKLLTHFIKYAKLTVIQNSTGSNLERGIASTLITHSGINGQLRPFDAGIWELDEAAFNQVADKLNPKVIIFLNALRDQLDRYGEVDSVVKKWGKTISQLTADTTIILNGDDQNIITLKDQTKARINYFGLADNKIKGEFTISTTAVNFDIQAKNIVLDGLTGSKFTLIYPQKQLDVKLPLPGIYHIYDFLAAFAAGFSLGLPPHEMIASLATFSPAFGRVETIKLGLRNGYIFLIKNPVGATQVFKTVAPVIKKQDVLLLALNDNLADGTDVSWIWDAEFEMLRLGKRLEVTGDSTNQAELADPNASSLLPNASHIIVSGTRAYDLALRLKYAGIEEGQIQVIPDMALAFDKAAHNLAGELFIFPTYTAMLQIQKILVKKGIKKEYWKEN